MAGLKGIHWNRDGFSCLSKWDDVMHNCPTCEYKDRDKNLEPCEKCGLNRINWKLKDKEDKKC